MAPKASKADEAKPSATRKESGKPPKEKSSTKAPKAQGATSKKGEDKKQKKGPQAPSSADLDRAEKAAALSERAAPFGHLSITLEAPAIASSEGAATEDDEGSRGHCEDVSGEDVSGEEVSGDAAAPAAVAPPAARPPPAQAPTVHEEEDNGSEEADGSRPGVVEVSGGGEGGGEEGGGEEGGVGGFV